MTEPTAANLTAAVRLLGEYTRGSFDCWDLMGPAAAPLRARILSTLTGRKVAKSRARVKDMQAAFYAAAQPKGDCIAARSKAFADWCRYRLANEH